MIKRTDAPKMFGRVSRVNWGAIIAGGLLAIAISLLLNLLGLGLGFSAIDPAYDDQPLKGVGTGSMVWFGISNLLAIFAGAWVAGRFAGFVDNKDGGLHGVMTWALYTFVSFVFLTSTISSVVSGLGNQISSVLGNNNQKIIVQTETENKENNQSSVSFNKVKNKAIDYLTKAEQLNLIPETISKETKEKIKNSGLDLEKMIKELQLDEKFSHYISGLEYDVDANGKVTFKANNDFISADDVSIKEYIAKNTKLTEAEVEDISKNISDEVNKITVKAEEYTNNAIEKSKEYAQSATDALAKVAIYSFFALLLGLIASYFAGALASPKHIVEAVELEKE